LILTALSDGLNQDGSVGDVLSVPLLEGSEHLESVGGRGDGDADGGSIGRSSLEGILSGVESLRRKLLSGRLSELEGLSVGSDEGVGERVEGEGSGEGHGGDDLKATRKEDVNEKSAMSRAKRSTGRKGLGLKRETHVRGGNESVSGGVGVVSSSEVSVVRRDDYEGRGAVISN